MAEKRLLPLFRLEESPLLHQGLAIRLLLAIGHELLSSPAWEPLVSASTLSLSGTSCVSPAEESGSHSKWRKSIEKHRSSSEMMIFPSVSLLFYPKKWENIVVHEVNSSLSWRSWGYGVSTRLEIVDSSRKCGFQPLLTQTSTARQSISAKKRNKTRSTGAVDRLSSA